MARILVVEDERSMAVALEDGLKYEGYEVILANDGLTALQLAEEKAPDLVILDVMLPKMSGHDVCREIRRRGSSVPVLMLTARGQEIDKVLGLKLGADDYVTKPFGFLELTARVEALLRRATGMDAPGEEYRFADIAIHFRRAEAQKGGVPITLSPRELRLLRYFIEHRGEVVTREELLNAVWDHQSPQVTRTVDMHVAKLRKKIEDDASDPRHIVTVHGLGYKFTG